MQPRVLTFGEALVNFVPANRGPLADQETFHLGVAGAELNTAIGLARLDIPAAFAGAVGEDALGDKVIKTLRREAVAVDWLERTPLAPTPLFIKERAGLPLKTYVYYYREASPMARGHWRADALAEAVAAHRFDWVHTTGITWAVGEKAAQTARGVLRDAQNGGIPCSFDINVRLKMRPVEQWREIVVEVMAGVQWLFFGDEEARLLFAEDEPSKLERLLREQGFRGQGVVVKYGERGAQASVSGAIASVPAHPAPVTDTVGAGDGFNAGWIAGVLRGYDLTECLRLGALIGAYAVTVPGDFDGYPTWDRAARDMSGESDRAR